MGEKRKANSSRERPKRERGEKERKELNWLLRIMARHEFICRSLFVFAAFEWSSREFFIFLCSNALIARVQSAQQKKKKKKNWNSPRIKSQCEHLRNAFTLEFVYASINSIRLCADLHFNTLSLSLFPLSLSLPELSGKRRKKLNTAKSPEFIGSN